MERQLLGVPSQILLELSIYVHTPALIALSFLLVGLLPELVQILNLPHLLVHLLLAALLTRISKLIKLVVLVLLLLRRDVPYRYLVLIP